MVSAERDRVRQRAPAHRWPHRKNAQLALGRVPNAAQRSCEDLLIPRIPDTSTDEQPMEPRQEVTPCKNRPQPRRNSSAAKDAARISSPATSSTSTTGKATAADCGDELKGLVGPARWPVPSFPSWNHPPVA